ncbi:hypothetical protein [Haloferula sp. A504]|uniref:hypothetical protein n=1 Tax=Haloferula sp. A504 TaxID=3373601 RepID=UPI0031BFE8F1|nr:hypothetical protein [Verrucomicrobiaceae bacterium E54]
MKKKPKPFVLRDGHCRVTIYPWKPAKGPTRWRFAWKDGERWRYVTRTKLDDIKAAARTFLRQMNEGFVYDALSPEEKRFLERVHRLTRPNDRWPVLAWIEARNHAAQEDTD